MSLYLQQLGSDDRVYVVDGLENGLSVILRLVVVAELQSLVDTGGSARGHRRPEQTIFRHEIDLAMSQITNVQVQKKNKKKKSDFQY